MSRNCKRRGKLEFLLKRGPVSTVWNRGRNSEGHGRREKKSLRGVGEGKVTLGERIRKGGRKNRRFKKGHRGEKGGGNRGEKTGQLQMETTQKSFGQGGELVGEGKGGNPKEN